MLRRGAFGSSVSISADLRSRFLLRPLRQPLACPATSAAAAAPRHMQQRRSFFSELMRRGGRDSAKRVRVNEAEYDKQSVHYSGKIFGLPVDTLVYYLKINGAVFSVCALIYLFFKGYVYLTQFSLATVGRLGFGAGFFSCLCLYSAVLTMKRWYHINPNAVYNQAIAMVTANHRVAAFLGQHPKTGTFKAFNQQGGFKLPLMRRIRSGQYELADLLGTKPRQLQMMFVLQSQNGSREGLVSATVRKHGHGFSASYYFSSLAVHMSDERTKEKDSVVLIGNAEDAVFKGILTLK